MVDTKSRLPYKTNEFCQSWYVAFDETTYTVDVKNENPHALRSYHIIPLLHVASVYPLLVLQKR